MEACGRCGNTQRALQLLEIMKGDGFVADSEVLACFVSAFAHHDADGIEVESLESLSCGDRSCKHSSHLPGSTEKTRKSHRSDAYLAYLRRRFQVTRQMEPKPGNVTCQEESTDHSECCSDSSDWSGRSPSGGAAFLDWFAHHQPSADKKKTRRRRKRKQLPTSHDGMPVTDMISRQLSLGESLLDYLYPDLVIDTNGDSCPQCSNIVSESDVVDGWAPCEFQDFTTQCPQCAHRFVPNFVVTCSSPTFEGSQGPLTPLYCEFLSPWVVRKELQHIIKGDIGVQGMLDASWRNGTGIEATLFWNIMVLCRRYRLPFTFLLQGSFQKNRLILPRKPSEM
jgi:pentatricopeptide repeat protein